MNMEVHVHGSVFLCQGVQLAQIENALRPWLDYLAIESIDKVQSLEREEPGIHFDPKEQALDICWTGEVGRGFRNRISEAFQVLGPLSEYASEITVTYYHDNGQEEFQQIFVGPTAEAIHEMRRQCVEEDVAAVLAPHFGKDKVGQVTALVNQLFDEDWKSRPVSQEASAAAMPLPHPRNRHLH